MMKLSLWDPWKEYSDLENRIRRVFEGKFVSIYPSEKEELETGAWSPTVDVIEQDGSYVVKADIPGVKKEDIDIDIKDRILTIRGEKKTQEKTEKEGYVRVERSYGKFVRNFTLPENVVEDKIAAKCTDGVLELTLPKKEEEKPKKIAIDVQ